MKEIQMSKGFVRAIHGKWVNIKYIREFYINNCNIIAYIDETTESASICYIILECDSDEEAQKALDYHMNKAH